MSNNRYPFPVAAPAPAAVDLGAATPTAGDPRDDGRWRARFAVSLWRPSGEAVPATVPLLAARRRRSGD